MMAVDLPAISERQFEAYWSAAVVVGLCVLLAMIDIAIVREGDWLIAICVLGKGPVAALYSWMIIRNAYATRHRVAGTVFLILGFFHPVGLFAAAAAMVEMTSPVRNSEFSAMLLTTGGLFALAGACTLRSLVYCLCVVAGSLAAAAITYGNQREVLGICVLHIGMAVGLAMHVRKHPEPKTPLCGECGYDCTGVMAGVCPECGANSPVASNGGGG